MLVLLVGLAAFFAIHMLQIIAPQWRLNMIDKIGQSNWRIIYSLVSLATLALLVWGYDQARLDNMQIYEPPSWGAHATLTLMAIAMVLLVAAMLKPGRIKRAIKYPFSASILVWAIAHLLVNGDLASLLLFGSFLMYAVWNRLSLKTRDEPISSEPSKISDPIAIVVGLMIWLVFVWQLHEWLIGVNPIA